MSPARLHRYLRAKRIGRRGLMLVFVGLAWIGTGIDIWINPLKRFTGNNPIKNTYLEFMDQPWTSLLWGMCGFFALMVGLFHDRRVVSEHEIIGFNAALTPPMVWALTYGWSFLTYLLTDGAQGRASSFVALFIFSLVTFFVLLTAGWPEPPDPNDFAMPKFPIEDDKG